MRSSLKFAKDAKRQLIHASQGGGGGKWGKNQCLHSSY